ncbi:uncharacterized protein DUF3231 [Scopulibacillus darangshiensis]|uniref:Uncharacterized protein DUF3231 n=1 Tax=Scopulibacillus darangshiensis TaxID=442528 RepID=A0A4R2NGK3_9BACL|nr:DUF3231 family protein [Scopulibacillus darangshiensis]TCP20338.1 uncharacterized protein DUF3231 [Scopulibacillus darangshiensis]
MKKAQNLPPLTSAEIANLWISYQNDTMAVCIYKYFLNHVEDRDVRSLIAYTLHIAEEHVADVTNIFKKENLPLPKGFDEKYDANVDASRLFSDTLYLIHITDISKFALSAYGYALAVVSREDIVAYYTKCLEETIKLHNDSIATEVKKGLYIAPPKIPKPEGIDFVKRTDFLAGWFDRRPLLAIEISNLVYNTKRNAVAQAFATGFSQVAQNPEVVKFFEQARELTGKQLENLNGLLNKDYLSATLSVTSEVTTSTVPPFSDKLMMYHATAFTSSGVAQYGVAMSQSPRRDIGVVYAKMVAEIALFAQKGANILIDNGWMEQPPGAADRKRLARE